MRESSFSDQWLLSWSNNPAREHIIDEPFTVYLPQGRAAYEPRAKKHLVCRLENTLQVRRISLGERKLLREVFKCNPPRDRARFAGDFQQPIESARNRTAQRLILRRRQCDGTAKQVSHPTEW